MHIATELLGTRVWSDLFDTELLLLEVSKHVCFTSTEERWLIRDGATVVDFFYCAVVVVDLFCIALFSALEQTHCALCRICDSK